MKILTNKQYTDLLLKSTRGMFGAVTDDMLLRNNAFINEENRELQARIDEAIEILGKYKIFSVPEEKQNNENEELVKSAYDILKGE